MTFDGKRLRGGVRAIQLTDVASGKNLVIGTVKKSVPGQLLPPNQLLFADAFDGGIHADVLYIWKHNAFCQDVILKSRPNFPAALDPVTTRLEVVSEFVDPPEAAVDQQTVKVADGPDLVDDAVIRLGTLSVILGRASLVEGQNAVSLGTLNPADGDVPVLKRWQRLNDGRVFLIESAGWAELQDQLKQLPAQAGSGSLKAEVKLARSWPDRPASNRKREPVQIANAPYSPNGCVFDFFIIPDDGTPMCLYGSVYFPSSGTMPVFTSRNDDLNGDKIQNVLGEDPSDGDPGPSGQVLMTYESRNEPTASDRKIFVNVDSDGVGSSSQPAANYTAWFPVNMEYHHDILAQHDRKIFRVPVVAWDRRSSGPNHNRKYLAFTDLPTTNLADTNNPDVYVMTSDDDTAVTWSLPRRVNDDTTATGQFFPGIAVDQTSGRVAVSWYDCRNDGQNKLTQFFAAVSTDGFDTAQPRNFQLSPSNGSDSHQTNCYISTIMNYGDYTGLAFHAGYFFPVWCSFVNTTDSCGDIHTCKVGW